MADHAGPQDTRSEDVDARDRNYVQSLARGLAVIRAFQMDSPELTLAEVARRSDLTRAAARRFLHTLMKLGYIRFDGRLFALQPKVLELGFAYLSSMGLPDVALPHMRGLVDRVHETSSAAVLDGDQVVYVARVPTRRLMTVAIDVGTRLPAYAMSMGRVLLAAQSNDWLDGYLARTEFVAFTSKTITDPDRLRATLTKVAAQGYSVTDQELEMGIRSVAVPLRGRSDEVTAALNVSVHALGTGLDKLRQQMLPELLRTASAIEADLRVSLATNSRSVTVRTLRS